MVATRRAGAVFLDRDGVINRAIVRAGKPFAPRRIKDFRMLPGVAAAVARLKAAGLRVVIVTNQPDIANGLVPASLVEHMHDRLRRDLEIDDIRMCAHRQSAGCACRKPRPGLLKAAARDHAIDLGRSFMVGDRASDMLAGVAAGCYTIFVDRGYAETRGQAFHRDATVRSLPGAARHILARLDPSRAIRSVNLP
jgi:D-glycero-D-manno-heptose 1,7-bisphosphate phosphatase